MAENPPTEPQPRSILPLLVKILGMIVLAFGAFAGYIAYLPNDFRIERSTTISAAPHEIFEHVNDFHRWDAWSPWAKLDPAAKNSFEGPDSGTGAIFRWAGNSQVGVGSMTITASVPHELVRMRLDFEQPMQDTSTADFVFLPQGDQTEVKWAMFGQYNGFFGKAMCKLMNMDKMVGGQFEAGLANMKRVAEAKN